MRLLLSYDGSSLTGAVRQFVAGILQEGMQKEAAEGACNNFTVAAARSDDSAELAGMIAGF